MLSFSGDKLGTVVNELLQVPYTEDQNKTADTYAFDLLKKNNNKTEGLVSALKKFADMEAVDKAAAESEDANAEVSGASKYTTVNSGSSLRASLISSK